MGEIYRIADRASGTTYVGSTVDVVKRWGRHRSNLRRGKHRNPRLQNAWNKRGAEAFEWAVLERGIANEDLAGREQFWLDEYRGRGEVYNCGECADNAMRGRSPSEETRRKLSEANKGKRLSEAHKRKISEAGRGRKLSEETKRKISQAKMGKPLSKEHRRRMSKAIRGRTLSEEHKRKIGRALVGRKFSEEHRCRIGEAHRGKRLSEEHKRKIGAANAGPHPAFCHRETGEVVPAGYNLLRLCRERGLTRRGMRQVIAGKQHHHKGWMLALTGGTIMTEGTPADDMAPDHSFIDIETADDAHPYWEDDVDMELIYLSLWDRIVRGLPIRGNVIEGET